MKSCHRWTAAVLFVVTLCASPLASAALVSRLGGQAYYDTDLEITWLADGSLPLSESFGVSNIDTLGRMDWETAQNWVTAMNQASYLGNSSWRLPTVEPINGINYVTGGSFNGSQDVGYNISAPGSVYAGSTSSELAYMYYNNLNNIGYYDINGIATNCSVGHPIYCLANTGPFFNLQAWDYWTGTDFPGQTDWAFFVSYSGGIQLGTSKTGGNSYKPVWVVADGDVFISSVPLPSAIWLFGSGLLGLIGRAKFQS
jgi:hypothetical protein